MASLSYALRNIRPALLQAAVVLACFGSGLALDHLEQLGPTIVVLTVVLGMTLGRTQRHGGLRRRLETLVTLPLISVACTEIGRLFAEHPNVADTLFTAALALSIWLRRFGPAGRRLGTLMALPFIALLVTPVPVLPSGLVAGMPTVGHSMLWSAVAAVIAFGWVWVCQELGERIGLVGALPTAPEASAPRRSKARIQPSTRMAVQTGLSLGLAFLIGRWAFAPHWSWIVLTAFVVNSGNRGRGDVAYKCLQRIFGACVGTVAATLLAGTFAPRDDVAVVGILVVLIVGGWLRTISYAYWAGCVTSMLSLLQGYFGETHIGLLGERLEQILIGGALTVAVAWFVLPIKSTAVLRRRLADALTALGAFTEAFRATPRDPEQVRARHAAFLDALAELGKVAPTFQGLRRLSALPMVGLTRAGRRGRERMQAAVAAIEAVRACAPPLEALAGAAQTDAGGEHLRQVKGHAATVRGVLKAPESALA
ncbi:FUSC family protein [Actinospica robiniae]|uniref:FUSC family protein n=1 Tax=Actinospica robiniae TaxID=304901 RepID=UPI0004111AD8|nr:FUSC family protein [Actinospica robiniae]